MIDFNTAMKAISGFASKPYLTKAEKKALIDWTLRNAR